MKSKQIRPRVRESALMGSNIWPAIISGISKRGAGGESQFMGSVIETEVINPTGEISSLGSFDENQVVDAFRLAPTLALPAL